MFNLEVVKKEGQLAFLTKREITCIRQVLKAFALDINRIAKVNEVWFFLGMDRQVTKVKSAHEIGWLDCFELVVVVDWDDKINDAVVAVDAVKTDAGLDS